MLSFLTRSTPVPENSKNQDMFVMFQFVDIAQHCTKKSIGIIVFTNGEIMEIKNRVICFAKRGSKWESFGWERIYLYNLKTKIFCILFCRMHIISLNCMGKPILLYVLTELGSNP